MTALRSRGYALIEVMVVLTITAAMLALCGGMIHLLLKLDRAGRTASEEAADLGRLARDFRADVHAARPVDPPARPVDRMTLSLDDGKTVEYLVRPRDVLRTLRDAGKVRRYETYRRPARTSATIEVHPAGPRPFANLVLDRTSDGRDDGLYHDYRIEAELGKDRRINPRPE